MFNNSHINIQQILKDEHIQFIVDKMERMCNC